MSILKNSLRQIIALGGGGFSDEPDNHLLDEYILKTSGKPEPKILFLPTAGGDSKDYITKFYKVYNKLSCVPIHLELTNTGLTYPEIESLIMAQDIIFTGGGSTKFLISVWKEKGIDKILTAAWKNGIVLSGMSAGAICWFKDGFTNPKDDIFEHLECLGFLKGSFCPHYSSAEGLKEIYSRMIINKELSGGYGVDDGVALHFTGRKLYKIISSRPDAKANKVVKRFGKIKIEQLDTFYLGE